MSERCSWRRSRTSCQDREISKPDLALLNKRAGHSLGSSAVSAPEPSGLVRRKREGDIREGEQLQRGPAGLPKPVRDLRHHSQDLEGDPVRMSEADSPIPGRACTDEITISPAVLHRVGQAQFEEWPNVSRYSVSPGFAAARFSSGPHEPALVQRPGRGSPQIMRAIPAKHGLKTLTEVMDSAHCEAGHSLRGRPAGERAQPELPVEENRPGHRRVAQDGAVQAQFRGHHRRMASRRHLTAEGSDNMVLCNAASARSRRPRFTLDITAIPVILKQSYCPVLCIDVYRRSARPGAVARPSPPWQPGVTPS